jgi:hypothetical protein
MSRTHVTLAGFYPPPFAGEPIHVKQLARFLRERDLDVDVLNLNRHALPSHEYLGASAPWGLMSRMFRLPDRGSILHLHTNGHRWKSWPMILTASLAARLRGVRAIRRIHSGLFPGYVARFDRPRRTAGKWILDAFDDVGKAMRGIGIDDSRLAVIPAFLGVGRSTELSPDDRARIDGGRPLLVSVGGGDKDPEMGLPTVIAVLPEDAPAVPEPEGGLPGLAGRPQDDSADPVERTHPTRNVPGRGVARAVPGAAPGS